MLVGKCATLRRINLSICSAQRRKRSPFKSHQFFRPSVAYLQQPLRILKQRPPYRDEIELLAIEAADQIVEGCRKGALSDELAGQADRSDRDRRHTRHFLGPPREVQIRAIKLGVP